MNRVSFSVEKLPPLFADFYGEKLVRLDFAHWLKTPDGMRLGAKSGEIPQFSDFEKFPPCAKKLVSQLKEYAAGKRKIFDMELSLCGTEFQLAVWKLLTEIPYGETRAYSELAADLGSPDASRAVAMAAHRNPICIIIPCHRLIGKSGALVGYASGVDIKKRLLEIETPQSALL